MSSIPDSVGYISHVHSLRLFGSLRGSLGTNGLTQKLCFKKRVVLIFKVPIEGHVIFWNHLCYI